MTSTAVDRAASILRTAGLTPLAADEARGFRSSGFTVEPGPEEDSVRITGVAKFTSQDKYDQWNEARIIAQKAVDVLERQGAGWGELDGREPNWVVDVFLPSE